MHSSADISKRIFSYFIQNILWHIHEIPIVTLEYLWTGICFQFYTGCLRYWLWCIQYWIFALWPRGILIQYSMANAGPCRIPLWTFFLHFPAQFILLCSFSIKISLLAMHGTFIGVFYKISCLSWKITHIKLYKIAVKVRFAILVL